MPDPNPCEGNPCGASLNSKLDKAQKDAIEWLSIQVPVVTCTHTKTDDKETVTTKRESQTIQIIKTSKGSEETQITLLFSQLADIKEELCKQVSTDPIEAIAVVPEWWQVRAFQRPQLVIQYAESLADNKIGGSRWAITIPHYNKPKSYKPDFPKYQKGNFEGILVLNDNSKIIINAKTKAECLRVLKALKAYVNPKYTKDIQEPKIGERPGVYKEVNVTAVKCHFFSKGQKSEIPDWSLKLRETNAAKK